MRAEAPAVAARGTSAWVIAGYAGLGMLCALLALVVFIFVAAPVDGIRDRVIDEVKARTGRDLAIDGGISLALFPTLGVTLSQVSLAAPAGMAGGPTVAVKRVRVEVGLASLFSRNPHPRKIVLTEPTFALRVDRNGRRSWDFARAGTAPVRYAQLRGPVRTDANAGARSADTREILTALSAALPVEVELVNGAVSYVDEQTDERFNVSAMDLTAWANAVDGPAEVKGTITLNGKPVDVTVVLSSISAALDRSRAELVVRTKAEPFSGQFEGTLALSGPSPKVDGTVSFRTPSLAALGTWLNRPITVNGPNDASLSARVAFADQTLNLSNFEAALGQRTAQGALTMRFTGRRPKLTGTVDVASLDFNALLTRENEGGARPATPLRRGQQQPQQPDRQPDPIGDLLKQQPRGGQATPQIRTTGPRTGASRDWSDDRLDTQLLGMLDAELRVSTQQILFHDLKTGASRVAINLTDKVLRLDLEDIDLYEGRGRGVATIDASGEIPAHTFNLTLDNVSAGALTRDLWGNDWVDGRTTVTLSVAGRGFTEREVVSTLGGTAELKTNGGSFGGFNFPKMVRGIETGQFPSMQIQPNERTSFSEFGASYVITNGVAQNSDLRLYTQNVRLTGAGAVNLPQRTLAYDLRAKLTGTGASQQQGAILNFANLDIPVRVEGPWDRLAFGLKGQEQINDLIRQIGRSVKSQEVQDVLRGLLGGNGDKAVKPRDFLDKFFKKE